MKQQHDPHIESVAEFLVHALELEEESVAHYEELADSMEVHNNPEVAELFRTLARYSRQHADEVRRRTSGMELPKIAPWDFKWTCPATPESSCMEDASYQMNACEALEIALFNEIRGRDFYAHVASTVPDETIRQMATEMVAEEGEHVLMLRDWLAKAQLVCEVAEEDLDPPNIPE